MSTLKKEFAILKGDNKMAQNNHKMTESEIIWEAYKIIRDVCEESETCGERCRLYETCKECNIEPHRFISNLHYDLFTKPIFDKLKFEDKPFEEKEAIE